MINAPETAVLQLQSSVSESTECAPEYLYLPAGRGTTIPDSALAFDRGAMRELATETLSAMGVDTLLQPGGDHPDDIVPKPHEKVAARDAAVAEQFHHPDVALNGLCGILLIGLEGDNPVQIPETHVVDNAAMVSHVDALLSGGPLQDRLEEIVLVRPFFDAENRREWMDLPRHAFQRLGSQFADLLTPSQLEHVNRERAKVTDTSRYVGAVSISQLQMNSVIDGTPLLTCGVAQRELRLSLPDSQDDTEARALTELHTEITQYLMNHETPHKAQKVSKGSAIFIPTGQLHKATPYLPQHHRSVVGVRCYAKPGQTPPPSWQRASGLDY